VSLTEVGHQGFAQRLIQKAVTRDRVPHAYLFHGPDGVGKEMLAGGLAQLLLCESPVDRSLQGATASFVGVDSLRMGCGTCADCRSVTARSHPDLHVIYRQLNREHPDADVRKRKALEIGVDVLRCFIIDKVGLTAHRGRAKVFLIREADRITPQAQNALLKTLEEPPGATFLILLVESLDRLLPTTLSRCQVVRFDALPTTFVSGKLAALRSALPAPQQNWYARIAEGSIGQALEKSDDALFDVNTRLATGLMSLMSSSSESADPGVFIKSVTEEAEALAEGFRQRDPEITDTEATRRGLQSLFQLTATCLADALRSGSGASPPPINEHLREELKRLAEVVSPRRLMEGVRRLAGAQRQLDLNANTQLVVETLVNDLARLPDHQRVSSLT